MKDTKVQWHPGFVAAMNLEFARNRTDLIFEKEYNLNIKPLEIDLLMVKKNASVTIMREAKPDGLFQYLVGHGYSMSNPYKGIYYHRRKGFISSADYCHKGIERGKSYLA